MQVLSGNKKIILFFLISNLLVVWDNIIHAQTGSDVLEVVFVKDNITKENGELSFNVAKVINNGNEPVLIQPVLDLPHGWAVFSNAFEDTIIPAGSSISFPFRFRTSAEASSEKEHIVVFKAFEKNSSKVSEATFTVEVSAFHNWDVIVPDKRVFFFPERDIVQFSFIIKNEGNTGEEISIDITPDRNTELLENNWTGSEKKLYLEPHEEEVIILEARYANEEARVFDIGKVHILAKTEDKKVYRDVILEKYSDKYSPFEVDRTLSNETELGVRTFARSNEVKPFLRARGNTTFKNDSKLRYNFTYYDILEDESVINNTYYNFLYTMDEFNVGVGAFSSMLGRNLYSRNCLMVSNTFNINDLSNIEGYASYGLVEQKANIAAAYSYNNENFNLKGSLAYDIDSYYKRNTASAVIHTGRFPVFKNHELRISLYGYNEDHNVKNPYSMLGYAWDLNYYGRITEKFDIHFTNNYGSPDIPGPQMGLKNFYTKLKFTPGTKNNYVTLNFINSSRDYFFYDAEGEKLPDIHLRDNYASFFFHNNSHKKARWYVGPSIEFYNSSHPIPENKRRYYDVDKYRMEFKGYFGRNLMINVKYGLGIMNVTENEAREENVHDFHVLSNYSNNGYGIKLAYDYGPMVNMGLYQYALDAGNHSVSVSPYILKSYFSGRVSLSMFTNYTYRFDLDYASLNINPKVETYVFKN